MTQVTEFLKKRKSALHVEKTTQKRIKPVIALSLSEVSVGCTNFATYVDVGHQCGDAV